MTPAEQEQLDRIEADRRRREDELILLLLLLLEDAELAAAAAVLDGTNPADAVEHTLDGTAKGDRVASIFALIMAKAHRDSIERIYRELGLLDPNETVDVLDGEITTEDKLVILYAGMGKDAEAAIIAALKEAISNAIKAAKDVEAAVAAIKEAFKKAGYSAEDKTGAEVGAERAVVTASNAGSVEGAVATGDVTGLEHVSVIDDRTTDICIDRDHLRLPLTHKYWLTNWPSLHWRCRSIIRPLYGEFTASTKLPTVPPMAGFGKAPPSIVQLLKLGTFPSNRAA